MGFMEIFIIFMIGWGGGVEYKTQQIQKDAQNIEQTQEK